MGDAPWQGDACSLVEAFRAGERSPVEELEATFAAIDASPLNAFSHLDREHALLAATIADGPLPATFGGVQAGTGDNGRLTFPANLHGNPAISIPAGDLDGLPIGLQVIGRHIFEPQLLEPALAPSAEHPWPLTATLLTTAS